MWWAIPLAMSVLGASKAEQQRKADIANNEMQAELTKYSPWTGQFGKIGAVSGGWMDGALQGGLSGLSMAQKMKESGFFEKEKAKTLDTEPLRDGDGPKGWSTLEASKNWEMPEFGSSYSRAPSRRYFGY